MNHSSARLRVSDMTERVSKGEGLKLSLLLSDRRKRDGIKVSLSGSEQLDRVAGAISDLSISEGSAQVGFNYEHGRKVICGFGVRGARPACAVSPHRDHSAAPSTSKTTNTENE